jgi:hypothetical protein
VRGIFAHSAQLHSFFLVTKSNTVVPSIIVSGLGLTNNAIENLLSALGMLITRCGTERYAPFEILFIKSPH